VIHIRQALEHVMADLRAREREPKCVACGDLGIVEFWDYSCGVKQLVRAEICDCQYPDEDESPWG